MKAASIVLVALLPRVALAERPHEIVVEIPGERSTANVATLAGITGGAVLAGAIGLYFHLDSRSLSDELSATLPTGKPWTDADRAKEAQAGDDRTRAAIAYSIGGALLVGAVVTYILTEPESERQVITPHTALLPTHGGAVVSRWWSF